MERLSFLFIVMGENGERVLLGRENRKCHARGRELLFGGKAPYSRLFGIVCRGDFKRGDTND